MSEILAVEDDAQQRADIEAALRQAGHRVDMAASGNQALARLKEKRYDLLITDLMVEEGTGFDVLQWVQENAPGLPVVICSSYAKGENLKSFIPTQSYRIVRKPFRTDDLVEQVREPSSRRQDFDGMLGGSDMLSRIEWYRNPEIPEPAAWLVADPAGDPMACTASHAFRPLAGGYVEKKGERVYHFPIAKIDLVTGLSEFLTLNVPFEGDIPTPQKNFSGMPDGLHIHGPYMLGVTWLDVKGNTLEMVIGSPNKASSVRFSLADLGSK
jgi:CheY-like chemotaxis protein